MVRSSLKAIWLKFSSNTRSTASTASGPKGVESTSMRSTPLSGAVTRKKSTSAAPTGTPRSDPMRPALNVGSLSVTTAPVATPLGSGLLSDTIIW